MKHNLLRAQGSRPGSPPARGRGLKLVFRVKGVGFDNLKLTSKRGF